MTEMTTRPPFLKSLLEAWHSSLDDGFWALFPYWLLISFGAGGWVAYELPADLLGGKDQSDAVAAMAGLLTLNGLILALSWSAFSKIYEIIGAGEFCAFLRRSKLLSHYLVYVGYVHIAQLVAVMATGFALFSILLPFQPWVMRLAISAAIGGSIYAIRQAVAASTVMQDLIWQRSAFDQERPAQPAIRGVNGGKA